MAIEPHLLYKFGITACLRTPKAATTVMEGAGALEAPLRGVKRRADLPLDYLQSPQKKNKGQCLQESIEGLSAPYYFQLSAVWSLNNEIDLLNSAPRFSFRFLRYLRLCI